MKKKFYETKSFAETQKEWYAKLKKSGFKDIETGATMKNNSIEKQIIVIDPEAISYMSNCERYLKIGKIDDKLDFFILEKHVEGLTQDETAELLKENNLKQIDRASVSRRLHRILLEAGITPYEFNSKR